MSSAKVLPLIIGGIVAGYWVAAFIVAFHCYWGHWIIAPFREPGRWLGALIYEWLPYYENGILPGELLFLITLYGVAITLGVCAYLLSYLIVRKFEVRRHWRTSGGPKDAGEAEDS